MQTELDLQKQTTCCKIVCNLKKGDLLMTADLYDDLSEEIFALIIDWIMTNDIDYNPFHCRRYGYLPTYPKDDVDKPYLNYIAISYTLRWVLFNRNIEALYERYKNSEDGSGVIILSVLEDEKLMTIHEKTIEWFERHRLYPEFNKVKKGRINCYRPSQYRTARNWLWRNYRKKLYEWRKKNI